MRQVRIDVTGKALCDARDAFAAGMQASYKNRLGTEASIESANIGLRELARLCAVVHGAEMLSEGQIANILGLDIVTVRKIIDEGRADLARSPIQGANGKSIMMRMGL